MDVNQYVAINIALLIDILIVAAGAGMIASLGFAEWQRAHVRTVEFPNAANSVSKPIRSESGDQSLTLLYFLISTSIFSLALLLGGWYGSIPMAEWGMILLAVLSALSITQTLFVARNRQTLRPAAQRISNNEGG